jgi:hypothetical protein
MNVLAITQGISLSAVDGTSSTSAATPSPSPPTATSRVALAVQAYRIRSFLRLTRYPRWSNATAVSRLKATATERGAPGVDNSRSVTAMPCPPPLLIC